MIVKEFRQIALSLMKPPAMMTASLLIVTLLMAGCDRTANDHTTWSHYGGTPDQSKYFNASGITKKNVNRLQVAWNYPVGDNLFYSFSPIVADTMMFVYAKNYSLIALHAATGKEIWIHSDVRGISRRGINYWESKDKTDKRLVFTLNNSLQVIDAMTGKTITSFGNNGYVDL